MIGAAARRAVGVAARPAARSMRFSTVAAEAPAVMKLNFCLPHEAIYKDKEVDLVVIPGAAGDIGVSKQFVPTVAELKPGVISIYHEEGKPPEKFFVSAGFSLTHKNSVTDISAIEAVRLEEIDVSALQAQYDKNKSAMGSATPGSRLHAEAQVGVETCLAMAQAIGHKVD